MHVFAQVLRITRNELKDGQKDMQNQQTQKTWLSYSTSKRNSAQPNTILNGRHFLEVPTSLQLWTKRGLKDTKWRSSTPTIPRKRQKCLSQRWSRYKPERRYSNRPTPGPPETICGETLSLNKRRTQNTQYLWNIATLEFNQIVQSKDRFSPGKTSL